MAAGGTAAALRFDGRRVAGAELAAAVAEVGLAGRVGVAPGADGTGFRKAGALGWRGPRPRGGGWSFVIGRLSRDGG
jgi:hypothetical protein